MPFTLPPVSRRNFLRTSVSAAAASLLARQGFAKGATGQSETWMLFSDSHVAADRTHLSRGINMADQLAQCVKEALSFPVKPVGAIHSGDIAFNDGLTADYATYRELITPLRKAGVPVHLMMGNHDDRGHFLEALKGVNGPSPVEHRIVGLVESPLVNWFLLDSLDQTNKTPGVLGETQLAWLAKALDAHQDKPAIIVVHHNVVPFAASTAPATDGTSALADAMLQKISKNALQDSAALLAVLRPRNYVKACIYGHTHTWLTLKDASGIHLINLPPTGYVFAAGMPSGWVNATLRTDGIKLELRSVDPQHPQQGQTYDLAWRA
jgi:3',5'-cyclic AMP phosphodiesterase CpdA